MATGLNKDAEINAMKICIFARSMRAHKPNYPTPFGFLIPTLIELGHEVTVITTAHPDGKTRQAREGDATLYYVEGSTPREINPTYWRESAKLFLSLNSTLGPFDLVMGRGSTAYGFVKYTDLADRIPLITHEGTYPSAVSAIENYGRFFPQWLQRAYYFLSARWQPELFETRRKAARVVAISPNLEAAFQDMYWWDPPNTEYLTYGFDPKPYEAASRGYATDDPKRLVCVARLTENKGVLAMAEVLSRLHDKSVIFEAIGPVDAKLKAKATALANRLGVARRYQFSGPVKNEDLPDRLAGASAFVLLTTHKEGVPKSLLESMAAGLPSVIYRFSGSEIMVKDGHTGHVIPRRNIEAAVHQIDSLLADPTRAAAMGCAANAHLKEQFSSNVIRSKWSSLIADVTKIQTENRKS